MSYTTRFLQLVNELNVVVAKIWTRLVVVMIFASSFKLLGLTHTR